MKITITLFALLLSAVVNSQNIKPEIIKVGDIAPTFTLNTLDGKSFNTKELKGKIIYLNFFATWCGICMKEMPFIENDIWKSIKHNDFVMLSIAREQTNEEIEIFRKNKNYTLPFAVDPTREIYSLFAPMYIPRNIVIDKDGTIIYSGKNYNPKEFKKMITLIKSKLN